MKRILIVTVLTWAAVIAGLLGGCSSDDESCNDPVAKLYITTQPSDATAEATGNDTITIRVIGQDEECNPLSKDTVVEFSLRSEEPQGKITFSNDDNNIEVPYGNFGAEAQITATEPSTARVQAYVGGDYNLQDDVEVTFIPASQGAQCGVAISAVPPVIIADGSSTTSVTATLTADKGGTMPNDTEVSFTTTRGKFIESGGQDYTTSSVDSTASASLQSEASEDSIDAEVTVTFTCDDGKLHSNTESVRFGPINEPLIDLRSSKSTVLADDSDTSELTAEVFLPGGIPAPENVMVNFFTEMGRFSGNNQNSYDGPTDESGVAYATFIGGATGGTAQIRASAYIEGQTASDTIDINIRALGNIRWVSSTPEKLGVKGSGRDESSTIIFELLDTEDRPFPAGALVGFSHSSAPGVTLDPLSARTDVDGQVRTTLNSGTVATPVTVSATAHVGAQQLSAESPSIAIVGAKPNARYLTFSCELLNVGGFILDFVETDCFISLADRYTNKIGFATNVLFRTEAGSIDAQAVTDDSGSDMGMAQTSIRTGNPRPVDVTPFDEEPFVGSRNPRDGLVTIIAATTGEEAFDDVNGNGMYDFNEPYVDMGEPFVDVNDNGEHEPNETQFIDANSNSTYDGPNGEWDSNTLIWVEVKMLWTGHVQDGGDCASDYRFSGLCPSTFDIAKGTSREFTWQVKDINLNPPNESLRVDVSVDGKGSLGSSSPPLSFNAPDTLGYTIDEDTHEWIFSSGFSGTINVNGAAITNMTPPETGVITLEANYRETPGQGETLEKIMPISGTFQ